MHDQHCMDHAGSRLHGDTGAVAGGFPAAVGAFIVVGLLIIVAAFWSPLSRLVQAIPKPLANAMLAGILLKLCLAPFVAIRDLPALGLAILAIWLVMLKVARLWRCRCGLRSRWLWSLPAMAVRAMAAACRLRWPGFDW